MGPLGPTPTMRQMFGMMKPGVPLVVQALSSLIASKPTSKRPLARISVSTHAWAVGPKTPPTAEVSVLRFK